MSLFYSFIASLYLNIEQKPDEAERFYIGLHKVTIKTINAFVLVFFCVNLINFKKLRQNLREHFL